MGAPRVNPAIGNGEGFEELEVRAEASFVEAPEVQARVGAGRRGTAGRAMGLVLSVLGTLSCDSSAGVGRDTTEYPVRVEAQNSQMEAPNVMFFDSKVKLLGKAAKPTNFLVRLKNAEGEVLLEQSHEVSEGRYNLDIEFPTMSAARTLEVVNSGRTFVYENTPASDLPEVPR